ncbi:MAG TPA: hypothetical protein VFS24_07425 [Steroidobacteraceae bacterium]|nr:hypothetical protein [Steroidobacteraceae bacterium]
MKARPIIMPVESPERRAERIQRVTAFLARLDGSKAWELSVKPWKKSRTPRQNNAMFGVAYSTLSNFTGYTDEELHQLMLKAYFGEVEYELMGVKGTKPRRTTTTNEQGERDVLSREDFSKFYNFIVQKAAEIGCYIEDPNPMLRTRVA